MRTRLKQLVVLVIGLFLCVLSVAQQQVATPSPKAELSSLSYDHDRFPIAPKVYAFWRKYGPWDFKQQSSEYRDYTLFNLGATGSATGMTQAEVIALSKASKPTQEDVAVLENWKASEFSLNAADLEKLRNMAEQDLHVIRIGPDFTLLDTNSKWPREDIGFPKARWNEYRLLFQKVSLDEGVVRTKDFPGALFFIVHASGLCTGGTSGGYVFSTTALNPIAGKSEKLPWIPRRTRIRRSTTRSCSSR